MGRRDEDRGPGGVPRRAIGGGGGGGGIGVLSSSEGRIKHVYTLQCIVIRNGMC